MIRTFRHKGLERFFRKSNARGIPADRVKRIQRMLDRLDVAERPGDMDLPGWQFHPLKGAMQGRYACSVSGTPSGGRLPFAQRIGQILDAQLEERYPNSEIEVETWGHLRKGHATASSMIGGFTSNSSEGMNFPEFMKQYIADYILTDPRTSTRRSVHGQTLVRLNIHSNVAFSHIFRDIPEGGTSRESPFNSYIREIYNLGFETVWSQISSTETIDFRDMGYSDNVALRLEQGLTFLRGRFQAEIARIRSLLSL